MQNACETAWSNDIAGSAQEWVISTTENGDIYPLVRWQIWCYRHISRGAAKFRIAKVLNNRVHPTSPTISRASGMLLAWLWHWLNSPGQYVMDSGTQALLDEMLEQAAADLVANGFTKVSATLAMPTRKRIQHAGEYLLERATERFPTLDPYVSSRLDGTITLVLDDHKKK